MSFLYKNKQNVETKNTKTLNITIFVHKINLQTTRFVPVTLATVFILNLLN